MGGCGWEAKISQTFGNLSSVIVMIAESCLQTRNDMFTWLLTLPCGLLRIRRPRARGTLRGVAPVPMDSMGIMAPVLSRSKGTPPDPDQVTRPDSAAIDSARPARTRTGTGAPVPVHRYRYRY